MGAPRGNDPRDLAWTIVGALGGCLARHWLDPMTHGATRSLSGTFAMAAVSAMLIGFAAVASGRATLKTVLMAAGGAAGSVGVAAVHAAIATPMQSAFGVAAFVAGAVTGLTAGLCVGSYHAARERC